ncbi:MAG: putative NUDIX hydrolase [Pelotomaculum sp. PtaU1.Bin035]|nr:MAG: putative NUDIX hydrolase [Pelotomaculum sp. PtaU1.Bin035]
MDNLKKFLSNRRPRINFEEVYTVSAVLLPIIEANGEPHVLFEVRASRLKRQPGEICFPGGRVEQNEIAWPQETAVREATEELGVARDQVELIGPLDYFVNPLGTLVYPFVGKIHGYSGIVPNPHEVEEIFLVPVGYFFEKHFSRSSYEVATRYAQDFPFDRIPPSYKRGWQTMGSFPVYFYEYGNRFIWGLTAGILHNFISLCRPEWLIKS